VRVSSFAAVEELVQATVASGRERGLQVAVAIDDEIVFEAWAGVADSRTGAPVTPSTLFPIFSATKGIVATAIHLLAERGRLDYDRPITAYWPEFAAGGKAAATVRHALLHQVGIPQMPPGTSVEQMCDWEHMTQAVAALPVLWEPGTRMGYHAYTYGWILGELIRRTDPGGRSVGRFVREEIAQPVAAGDLWIGIPDQVEPRIARLEEGRPALDPPPDSLILKAIPPQLHTSQEVFGRADVRRERRLLSEERVLAAARVGCDDVDLVLGRRVQRGLGYWIAGDPEGASSAPMGPDRTSFGHPGAGCSIAWADGRRRAGVALLKNLMLSPASGPDNPLTPIADSIRASLDR
jgi:CubicO group peptidase (beta-lactamase class C family)